MDRKLPMITTIVDRGANTAHICRRLERQTRGAYRRVAQSSLEPWAGSQSPRVMPPKTSGRKPNTSQTVGANPGFTSIARSPRNSGVALLPGGPTGDGNYYVDAGDGLVPATAASPSVRPFNGDDQQYRADPSAALDFSINPDSVTASFTLANASNYLVHSNSPFAYNNRPWTEHSIHFEAQQPASQDSQSPSSLHVPSVGKSTSAKSASPSPSIIPPEVASPTDDSATQQHNTSKSHNKPHWLTAHPAQHRISRGPTGVSNPRNRMSEGVRGQEKRGEDGERSRSNHFASGGSGQSSVSGRSQSEDYVKSDHTDHAPAQENKGAGQPLSILRNRGQGITHDEQWSLPAEKGFPIQIGSELFRLSGASIMSDGQPFLLALLSVRPLLRMLEHPHISHGSSRNNSVKMMMALGA